MPDLTTAALLAIIAPHREMLKGMGWEVEPLYDKVYVVISCPDGIATEPPAIIAARIIADACMESLETYGRKTMRMPYCGPTTSGHTAGLIDMSGADPIDLRVRIVRTYTRPTRIAALLALCAWCQEVKG
jgi:hypothetical protein